ncbi:MAG: glycosyltransferase [Candidatus Heimdallarchaeota archaeon]
MRLYYFHPSRIPTEKAHGKSIVKTCEALGRYAEVILIFPGRRTIRQNLFDYYGVERNFRVVKTPTVDFFTKLNERYAFLAECILFLFFAMILLAKDKNKKIVLCREYFMVYFFGILHIFLRASVYLELHSFKFNRMFDKALELSSGVFVINNQMKRILRHAGYERKRIDVLPVGVTLSDFIVDGGGFNAAALRKKFGINEEDIVVGHLGTLRVMGMDKGVQFLIRAFLEAVKSNPYLRLLFIGLKQDEIGLTHDRIVCTGFINPKLVPKYLSIIDAGMIPFPFTTYYRNFPSPMKLFEYMASGKGVVSAELPPIKEVLGELGIYYDPKRIESLIEVLKNLDSDALRIQGAFFRKQASNYTWDRRARTILISLRY